MSGPADSSSPPTRKSEIKVKVLQDRIIQLERDILDREQAAYERLDAIAKSSEALQSHYHRAIEEQTVLAAALEQSHAQARVLQQSLDLSDSQLDDLRIAYSTVSSRLEDLRAGFDREVNEKMQLVEECEDLRSQLSDLAGVNELNSRLLLSIRDLDQVVGQAEARCKALPPLSTLKDVHHLREMLSESELRISELSISMESERGHFDSERDSHLQELDGLRSSLSAAERDYGELLHKFQALECQLQEKSQLVQTLSAANQLLGDDARTLEDQVSTRDTAIKSLELKLEEASRLLQDHLALDEAHQQLLQTNHALAAQVQSLSGRENDLLEEIRDLNAHVIAPQRVRLDQLEATIAELSSTITRLNGVVEENQNLKREMELLRIDSSINEQALDQQLRLTEAQRQSAETRCHEISIALDQANLEISTQRDSFHQFQDGLKNQLLSLREALSSDS